jgi:predicted  nucleic acid-binding Zn-ribbon protein
MKSVAGHARGIVDAAILAEGIKLERELNAANDRIKRLESKLVQIDKWHKAKEAKP